MLVPGRRMGSSAFAWYCFFVNLFIKHASQLLKCAVSGNLARTEEILTHTFNLNGLDDKVILLFLFVLPNQLSVSYRRCI